MMQLTSWNHSFNDGKSGPENHLTLYVTGGSIQDTARLVAALPALLTSLNASRPTAFEPMVVPPELTVHPPSQEPPHQEEPPAIEPSPPAAPSPQDDGIPEGFRSDYAKYREGVDKIRGLTDKKAVLPAVVSLYREFQDRITAAGPDMKTRCANDLSLATADALEVEVAEAFTLIKTSLGKSAKPKPEKAPKDPAPPAAEAPPTETSQPSLLDLRLAVAKAIVNAESPPPEEELPPPPVEVDTTQQMLRGQVMKLLEGRPKKTVTDILLSLIEAAASPDKTVTTEAVQHLVTSLGDEFFVGIGTTTEDVRKRVSNASMLQVLAQTVKVRRVG